MVQLPEQPRPDGATEALQLAVRLTSILVLGRRRIFAISCGPAARAERDRISAPCRGCCGSVSTAAGASLVIVSPVVAVFVEVEAWCPHDAVGAAERAVFLMVQVVAWEGHWCTLLRQLIDSYGVAARSPSPLGRSSAVQRLLMRAAVDLTGRGLRDRRSSCVLGPLLSCCVPGRGGQVGSPLKVAATVLGAARRKGPCWPEPC